LDRQINVDQGTRSLSWVVKDEIDALLDTLSHTTLTVDKMIITVGVAYSVVLALRSEIFIKHCYT
jgi:hypothetical protein